MKQWKLLMFLPILLLVIMSAFLGLKYLETGELIDRSIELKGGKQISVGVSTQLSAHEIQEQIPETNVRLSQGVSTVLIIETEENVDENSILASLNNVEILGQPTVNTVGPVIGEVFFQQAQIALIIAFILMAIVVFFLFRSIAPSIAVMFAAITDIVVTFAFLSILEVKISLTIIAGLLMLIGYSIDTDILLTTRILKRRDDELKDRIQSAVKTGLTMTSTTLVALAAMFLFSGSIVLQEIAMVLIIGLLVDVPVTYLTNVGILRMYLGEKESE